MTDISDMESGWVPVTPGGTVCTELGAETEDEAWALLMKAASHMPYPNKEAFVERGYEVCEFKPPEEEMSRCPAPCNKEFRKDFGALSRKDNKTWLCSRCGTIEALGE